MPKNFLFEIISENKKSLNLEYELNLEYGFNIIVWDELRDELDTEIYLELEEKFILENELNELKLRFLQG